MKLEKRTMVPAQGDFSTRAEGDDLYIEGYFAVFNSTYEICPGIVEIIAPGAFADTLGEDIRALTNHDTTLVLGRNKAGTLTLKEDTHGLWGSIRINSSDSDAVNTHSRVARGDVDQCSFGFYIEKEDREVLPDGTVRYTILKVRLLEVSVVTFPAYEETSVSARTRQEETIRKRLFAEHKESLRKKLKGES
ncbi:HK97 family phage prohead protease [Dysosmobacter sp.]|uniref:HK97 family phage prohead protease n=1 Tax=Dysosmobacter sp. TaxID=2591382 RepID=UPI003D8ADED2